MPSVAEAVLTSWSFPPWITALNLLTVLLYIRGWSALHRAMPGRFTVYRLMSLVSGIATLQIALASPIDAFDPFLLTDHMLQHMLLMMIVPPLVLLGDPVIPLLQGLPRWATRNVVGPVLRSRAFAALTRLLTYPPVSLLVVSAAMIGWHLPVPYELALRSPGWHEVEHASFLMSSLIFWWPVVQPWPGRPRWNTWMLPVYLLLADFVNSALSAFLAFSDRVFYPSYLLVPRLGGISAQNDQVAAGAMMWVVGSFAFLIPAAAITVRLLSPARPRVERPLRPALPESRMLSHMLMVLAVVLPLAAIGYGLIAPEKIDIDGDVVRMQGVSGPFHISVITAPDPVPSGEFEVAVLIQDQDTSATILDGDVEITVQSPEGQNVNPTATRATRERAANHLLEAAWMRLPSAGTWELTIAVRRGDDHGSIAGKLEVARSAEARGGEIALGR
jgi:cytochrome c oxidase assembly factor CtaG